MQILPLFTPFDLFLLVLFALITGISGVVLLIVGLSRKKTRLWVSAIFILLVAFIVGASGIFLGVRKVIRQSEGGNGKKYSYRWFHDDKLAEVDESFLDVEPEESYTLETNAVLVDEEGDTERVLVLATEKLNKKGLFFESSDGLSGSDDLEDNNIYLTIKFDKPYRGYLQLKAFDNDKNGLAKSEVEIDIDEPLSLQLAFHLDDEFAFSELEYCTLSTQKD